MRWRLAIFIAVFLCNPLLAQNRAVSPEPPKEFEIGRHTSFDSGPPFDFYEVFIIRPTVGGASIERITLTPIGDECVSPAKVEVVSVRTPESVSSLLGLTNPCSIPEKDVQRELKRRKKGPVFSYAEVMMQVQCGSRTRLIRTDILDRDMFDPAPSTPEHTSWTMRLLSVLDRATGPGVMDQPMFHVPEEDKPPSTPSESAALRDVGAGKFDALFPGAPEKPSEVYREAQHPPPLPTVRIIESGNLPSESLVLPKYPPLARMVRVEGPVSFQIDIDENGLPGNLVFDAGHPMLRKWVENAVRDWRFPKGAPNQKVRLTIGFALNCHPTKK